MDIIKVIEDAGGKPETGGILPDGSGFLTASFPLPKDHWLTAPGFNVPPMGLRTGTDDSLRKEMEAKIAAAARYAVRASTMNGADEDFDPDALVLNMIVGLLGYFTANGLSSDEWANPKETK